MLDIGPERLLRGHLNLNVVHICFPSNGRKQGKEHSSPIAITPLDIFKVTVSRCCRLGLQRHILPSRALLTEI
jgi:hypothetical protein